MRRATTHLKKDDWPEVEHVGDVTLTYEDRHRRRLRMSDDTGEPFLLDLPKAVQMADGDGLQMADGTYLRVKAAAEAVVDLTCATAEATTRLAWHIGNRHIPLQIFADGRLRMRDDHVIVAMAERLGARAKRQVAPFTPETGAYSDDSQTDSHGHAH
jgi:urease accessory protein